MDMWQPLEGRSVCATIAPARPQSRRRREVGAKGGEQPRPLYLLLLLIQYKELWQGIVGNKTARSFLAFKKASGEDHKSLKSAPLVSRPVLRVFHIRRILAPAFLATIRRPKKRRSADGRRCAVEK